MNHMYVFKVGTSTFFPPTVNFIFPLSVFPSSCVLRGSDAFLDGGVIWDAASSNSQKLSTFYFLQPG